MVRAPRPVAWDIWAAPGTIDMRFEAANVFDPLPTPVLGDRGMIVDALFCSGTSVLLLTLRFVWDGRGGGWTDFALAARDDEKLLREVASDRDGPMLKSSDVRVVSAPLPLSDAFETRLGRRVRAGRLP